MTSQVIKNNKYMAVTMYRRREKARKLKSQLAAFMFCLSAGCTVLFLLISSIQS